MKTRRVPITISISPEMTREYEKLARQQAKNRSQLFRDMLYLYKEQVLEKEFCELQRYGSNLAKKMGIITEKDVERLVFKRY
jgi:metal-responsive CopG/Arc/MetJ family transcriptional regulator